MPDDFSDVCGHWIYPKVYPNVKLCSICLAQVMANIDRNKCPNCGAKMIESHKEADHAG